MNDLMNFVQQETARDISDFEYFKPGDQIAVTYKIVEGDKERQQTFRGNAIQIKGTGSTKTFTVRKISNGVGVERIFPFNNPTLVSIKNLKRGRVRRARLYYLRDIVGRIRIKERKFTKTLDASQKGKTRRLNWTWGEKVVK